MLHSDVMLVSFRKRAMHTVWTSTSSSVRRWVCKVPLTLGSIASSSICRHLHVADVICLCKGAYVRNDVFEDTAILCQRVNKQVGEVFSSPETVMAKLIQNIFENKLQVFLLKLRVWCITLSLVIFNWLCVCRHMLKKNWMKLDTQM